MSADKLVIETTDQTIEIFNSLNKPSATGTNDSDLKTDLFSLFYLQNPVIKNLEEVPAEQWLNYFIIQGILDHYSFKNIQPLTKDHPADSYWMAEKVINEFKILKENKKTSAFFTNAVTFFNNSINKDYEDLIKEKSTIEIKKQLKALISKVLININGFFKKIEPLLELTRGHDLAPLALFQFDDSRLLQLTEKLQNPKYKEVIKAFNRFNVKEMQDKTSNVKKDESQSEITAHNIFYINDSTQEQKEIYKNWVLKEVREYSKSKSYKTQLTAYLKAGNLVSKADEIDNLSFALNLLEIARWQKRNFNVIISKDILGDKTFIFKNNDEVEIFENDKSFKFPVLYGMVDFVIELLAAPTPPKPKFSLGLSFSSKKKSKVFKKPPTAFIKFT
ncbi:MAG: hypothetical protein PHX78_00030 [bacterium]|nr:hypothetical protein [bacterium]